MIIEDAGYYKKTSPESKALKMVNGFMREGVDHCEPKHKRSEENNNLVRGEQWSTGDAERQSLRDKPAMSLNSMIKILNAVANREIMDRIVPRVYGRNEEDNGVAQVLDITCNWQRDMAETEHEETMAFRNNCASGYGVMHKWWDPAASDGKGLVRDESLPIWYMLWDSRARKQNLVDRKWHMCGKFVPVEDLESEFGDMDKHARKMFKAITGGAGMHIEPDPYNRPGGLVGAGTWGQILSNKWVSSSRKEVFVVETEWEEVESFYKAAIPVRWGDWANLVSNTDAQIELSPPDEQNPEGMVLTSQQYGQLPPENQKALQNHILSQTEIQHFDTMRDLEPFMEQFEGIVGEEFIDYRKERRYIYKYVIIANNVVLELGERPYGFTYEFLTGFPHETRESTDFFGMVDVSKMAQDFKNVFFSNLLTIYMTSPKQHLIIEESALGDVDRFLDEYAKVSGVSIVPDGFVANKRFETLQTPSFPDMLPELIRLADDQVERSVGLSSIEMGAQGDLRRVSGNVVQAAKQSSNTSLAILFDALRRYRRRFGALNAKYMMNFYPPEEISKIVGEEKSQYIAGLKEWPDIAYDVKIDESPTSVSEQMETIDFLTRTGTLDNWWKAKEIEFDDILDLMVQIPQSTRDKIRQRRSERQAKDAELQQAQQQAQQLSMKYEALLNFIQSHQGGGAIVAQYDMLEALSVEKAQELQAQQQQQPVQGAA